jgi:hypothetical protein
MPRGPWIEAVIRARRLPVEARAPELPSGRMLAMVERGVVLRATWRLDRGFLNLSLWRNGRCVETFHLTPATAAEFMSFLVHGLADATTLSATAPVLSIAAPSPPRKDRWRETVGTARSAAGRLLRQAAQRVDP